MTKTASTDESTVLTEEAPQPPDTKWLVREADPEVVAAISSSLGCPDAIARILAARGLAPADLRSFLNPTFDDLHDPFLLLGMTSAVDRIRAAVQASEPILIYGDYDVDGTTATVLLKTAIERIAPPERPAKVTYHVPHRIREGYGMQTNVLGLAATSGIRLVISVDTGIRAFAAATEAKALGMDLIVTDHHLPDDASGLPEALAVINPAQPNCPYPNKHLCGAAVAFKLAQALLEAHAPDDHARQRLRAKTLPSFLKLTAIATIADSVPLTGENRTIVWLGLRELANPRQPGLRALMQVAKLPLNRAPSVTEVGFRIAPRINAAGRMDVAADVVELFLTRDPAEAQSLALKLDRLNQARRATEAEALAAIDLELSRLDGLPPGCIILDHPQWHRGVLGILASRVVDRTGRPALILTHQDGSAHGSGRSIPGFHLLEALTAIHEATGMPPLFTRFGGHAYAVGLTLPSDQLAILRSRMTLHTLKHLTPTVLKPIRVCDAEIRLSAVDEALHHWLGKLAPFGNSATEPLFITRNLSLAAPPRILKERHICLKLNDADASPDHAFEALGWSRTVDWIQRTLGLKRGSRVDVIYRICSSEYQQVTRSQLELVDLFLSVDSANGKDAAQNSWTLQQGTRV